MKKTVASDVVRLLKSILSNTAVIVVSAALLLVGFAPPALGEECISLGPKRAYRSADVVFLGTVIEMNSVRDSLEPLRRAGELALERAVPGNPYVARFAVSRVWKGKVGVSAQVFGLGLPEMGSAFRFRVGETYVVYALDDLNQRQPHLADFAKHSRVYSVGVTCVLRVSANVAREEKHLGLGRKP